MNTTFVKQVRQLRRAAGWSQSRVAAILGTTRQRYSRWESSVTLLNQDELKVLEVLINEWRQRARSEPPLLRACSRCREIRPVTDFNRDTGRAAGRQRLCASCSAEVSRLWRMRQPKRMPQHSITRTMQYLRRDYDAFDALGDVYGMHWVDEQYVPPKMAN